MRAENNAYSTWIEDPVSMMNQDLFSFYILSRKRTIIILRLYNIFKKIHDVVDGKEYIKRKWIGTEYPVPVEGSTVQLAYEENQPEKIKVVY